VVTQRLSLIPTVIVVFSTGLNPDQKSYFTPKN
jgi:hypothetical protein